MSYFVPSFPTSLLSVYKLCTNSKCQVIFTPTNCLFQDAASKRLIGRGYSRGKLYYLQIKKFAASRALVSSAMQWHNRLGHPSLNKLKLLVPTLGSMSHLNCETCQLSTHHKESYPSQSLSKSSQPFDLVQSDLWGPLNVPNLGNFKYYVIFVDDYSRVTRLYFLKDRSEVFKCFQIFVNEIKTHFAAVLNRFRSDNALEYMSSHFQDFFHDHGIIHETSCAHTPNQNGVYERKHRHLLEVTRCLLINSSVPKSYWPEALLTSCYLINRMPNSALQHGIPYSVLHPNSLYIMSNLRCSAVHVFSIFTMVEKTNYLQNLSNVSS